MIKSMTGFGSEEAEVGDFGKISIELRSTNHKFLEIVFHLPDGFLSLEDKIKKEIESKIKRGRITCAVNMSGQKASGIFVNRKLLKSYIHALSGIKKEFSIDSGVSLDSLIRLPGVITLKEDRPSSGSIWPQFKTLLNYALAELLKARQKEGAALSGLLKTRAELLKKELAEVKLRFKKAAKARIKEIDTDEERATFLKNADIAEEIDRLDFHILSLRETLNKSGSVGKELDFITQEMQREANTLAAKSFDLIISGRAVQMKSQIEKIREQVQNVE